MIMDVVPFKTQPTQVSVTGPLYKDIGISASLMRWQGDTLTEPLYCTNQHGPWKEADKAPMCEYCRIKIKVYTHTYRAFQSVPCLLLVDSLSRH